MSLPADVVQRLKRDGNGLVCAVVQDHGTGRVLMVGYMDDEALNRTLHSGLVTFWSRSRQQYWVKGETSGNVLRLVGVEVDCDGDALLIQAVPSGPTCHTGVSSCFDAGGSISLPGPE
ncbi:phosphoribosyl-AMP cyclohydrolase [Actinomyces minihominis]|uniref:phosphoribosyl-AMP cyclohydrolase n=1 Tax=Actinomyces minihominis TaxID=2002838 RepID=UPI000C071A85|nr:phosphoribosyl-AMP cyclohydrolase [Actinomyces minihominis]